MNSLLNRGVLTVFTVLILSPQLSAAVQTRFSENFNTYSIPLTVDDNNHEASLTDTFSLDSDPYDDSGSSDNGTTSVVSGNNGGALQLNHTSGPYSLEAGFNQVTADYTFIGMRLNIADNSQLGLIVRSNNGNKSFVTVEFQTDNDIQVNGNNEGSYTDNTWFEIIVIIDEAGTEDVSVFKDGTSLVSNAGFKESSANDPIEIDFDLSAGQFMLDDLVVVQTDTDPMADNTDPDITRNSTSITSATNPALDFTASEENGNNTGLSMLQYSISGITSGRQKFTTDGSTLQTVSGTSVDYTNYKIQDSHWNDITDGDTVTLNILAVDAAGNRTTETIQVTKSNDSTAPTFNAGPSLSAIDTENPGGFTIGATTDEDSTLYYVVVLNTAGAPSAAQVKAGQKSGGAAAEVNGSFALTANNAGSTTETDSLTSDGTYTVYAMAEDSVGNQTNVQTVGTVVVTTTDTTAPTITSGPTLSSIDTDNPGGFTIGATTDEDSTLYYVAVLNTEGAPSAAQVKAGQKSGGAAAEVNGSFVLTATNAGSTTETDSMASDGTYTVYAMAEDSVGNQTNVQTVGTVVVTTTDTTDPQINLLAGSEITSSGENPHLSITATDNSSLDYVQYRFNSASAGLKTFTSDGSGTIGTGLTGSSFTPSEIRIQTADWQNIASGETVTIYIEAADTAGNTATAQISLSYNPFADSGLSQVKIAPNLFRPSEHSAVSFMNLPGQVELSVYDINGRRIFTDTINTGYSWQVRDSTGRQLKSGVYLAVLKDSSGNKRTMKMVVVR